METTFYDDHHHHHHHHQSFTKENINMLKKRMTLDLQSDRAAKKPKFSLLSSPDLNMLKLASPELEKLIISSNGMVTTTPTPTQFIFPRNVTEEQEMYARGFVDALAELHKANVPESPGIPIVYVSTTGSNVTTSSSSLTSTAMHGNNNANLVSLHNPGVTTVTVTSTLSPLTTYIKDEPQTVPNLGATPPLSPIDMETQEKIKLERKRQRNRIAASKCRRRKLERIARLEDKVKQLKGENSDLSNIASKLREQICQLKQQVMEHVNSGCQIMTQY